MPITFPKVASLKTVNALRDRLLTLGVEIPLDDDILTAAGGSPLAAPGAFGPLKVGNRFCIHPMEGWDAEADGAPSEWVTRRWKRFGASGAKLIWGGEAAAVRHNGRANPNQLVARAEHERGFKQLLESLKREHEAVHPCSDDLVVGLQLTHSGRYSKPNDRPAPWIAWHHPVLDKRLGIAPDDHTCVATDSQLESLLDDYVHSAALAYRVGFHFVDIKCCHGYLLHEFLGAHERPGPYGGDLAGRTRLLRSIIERVRNEVPGLLIGVRLSAADVAPFINNNGEGTPDVVAGMSPYQWGFGMDSTDPTRFDLAETVQLLGWLREWGVVAVNISCGSPYYNPHILRPAAFPPSDGYAPPVDPFVGVADHLLLTRTCKLTGAGMAIVGSGYTYLQDYVPHAAQAAVRYGWTDFVGLGRMALSYPELPRDVLTRGMLDRKRICRTFSDCTTAPRNGIRSGCYPLDPFYKESPEAQVLLGIKQRLSRSNFL